MVKYGMFAVVKVAANLFNPYIFTCIVLVEYFYIVRFIAQALCRKIYYKSAVILKKIFFPTKQILKFRKVELYLSFRKLFDFFCAKILHKLIAMK
jgi:hypothetical protein